RAHGHNAPGAIETHLDLVRNLARVVGGYEVLTPALDPLHRAAELQRGERHQDVLGIELPPDAEAAAHVHLGEAQSTHRDAEDRRQDRPVDVDALGRADQV